MRKYIQVITTIETEADASELVRSLVESRLCACGQVLGPIQSTYWWKGKLEKSNEYLCILKTKSDKYPEVEQHIRELHPYENPEIIVTGIEGGSEPYLEWIEEETKSSY